MDPAHFRRELSAALDPVLVPVGFAAGQFGGTQAIFCAEHDTFSDRFPHLPPANEQERGAGCCVDVDVDVDAADRMEVQVEGWPLAEVVHAAGLGHRARRRAAALTTASPASFAELADLLAAVFRGPSGR